MTKKKIIVAGLIIAFMIILAASGIKQSTETSGVSTPNAKEPPVVQSTREQTVQEQTTSQALELSDEDASVICEQPPKGNEYGGIAGSESHPPNGTTVDQSLTKSNGRLTATGTCGTYQYIAGWWFNTSEMEKLPSDTIMYGVSPYAITHGGGGTRSGSGENDNGDNPITPVSEITGIILVSFGIFVIVVWKKLKNK